MGIKERRQRHRQELRGNILDAAREIASTEGWQSVTIRKIAERIEYSPPALYAYFDSKEDLLLELMRMGYAGQLEAVESARKTSGSPEEALAGIAHAWWSFAIKSPDLYQVMYGLGGVSFPITELRQEGEKISDVVGEVIEGILRKNGKEAKDVEGKVTLLWGTAHGLVALAMAGRIVGGNEEAKRLVNQAARDYLTAWLNT
ncbi:MAG: TetR/AcrR family transcriptional regulator [Rubrobacter sp.]|nr:TetR/AcrR family transcriptional regulator [Rubrobacter sp.]